MSTSNKSLINTTKSCYKLFMKTMAERIIFTRDSVKLSQIDLANMVPMNQQALQKIESGKVKHSDFIPRIAEALTRAINRFVDPGWLQYGMSKSPFDDEIPEGMLPLIKWEQVLAWKRGEKIDEKVNFISLTVGQIKNNCYALEIQNDAMEHPLPGKFSFLKNEIIVIDPGLKPENGNFVLALEKENKEMKDIPQPILRQYITDGTMKCLRAFNQQFYRTLPVDNHIEILGTVIARLTVLI